MIKHPRLPFASISKLEIGNNLPNQPDECERMVRKINKDKFKKLMRNEKGKYWKTSGHSS